MLNKDLYPCVKDQPPNHRQQYRRREMTNDELHLHEPFDYYYNNFGFRSINEEDYDLTDINDIWCFGCSFTHGVGVSRQNCWPGVIQTKTNRTVKNFGIGRAGPITTYRLMKGWYNSVKNKPKKIFVFGFFPGRTEIWDENKKIFITQTAQETTDLPYDPFEIDSMYENIIPKIKQFTNTTVFLNLLDIKKLAHSAGKYDNGRDASKKLKEEKKWQGHPGTQFHEFVADMVINEYL